MSQFTTNVCALLVLLVPLRPPGQQTHLHQLIRPGNQRPARGAIPPLSGVSHSATPLGSHQPRSIVETGKSPGGRRYCKCTLVFQVISIVSFISIFRGDRDEIEESDPVRVDWDQALITSPGSFAGGTNHPAILKDRVVSKQCWRWSARIIQLHSAYPL